MKIAVLGGSFDPIHKGHIEMANYIIKNQLADEVWFMPTMNTPLKDRQLTDYKDRCNMVKLAIKPYRKMKCSYIESYLPTPSYTINTVRYLKRKYINDDFLWVIGEDQYEKLDSWKESEELLALIDFIVFNRNSDNKEDVKYTWINGFNHPASSTLVRSGEFKYCDKSVIRYIQSNGLYLDSIARGNLSEYRYNHCLDVSEMCMYLAKIHNVSLFDAYKSAILHDIAKEFDSDTLEQYMKIYYPDKLDTPKAIWHGWVASVWLKTKKITNNYKVLYAIEHHVLGDGKSKLSKILYIADKANKGREYPIDIIIMIAEKDLDEAVIYIKEMFKEKKEIQ